MSHTSSSAEPKQPSAPALLARLQSFMVRLLVLPEAIPGQPALEAECERFVTRSQHLSPAQHVDIYRRQFWLRHQDVLAEDFPALFHVLGEAQGEQGVDELVRAYLIAHPPLLPELRDLGTHMASFVAVYPGLPAGLELLCNDLARYELAFAQVFDGLAPPPLSAESIAALGPEALTCARFVPSQLVKRLDLSFAVHRYRKALRSDATPPLPQLAPCRVALFRHDNVVHFEELDDNQWQLLELLAAGDTLIAACEKLTERIGVERAAAVAPQVGPWFQRWVSWGVFADIQAAES